MRRTGQDGCARRQAARHEHLACRRPARALLGILIALAALGISAGPLSAGASERATGTSGAGSGVTPRIVNGTPASIGDFPWYVALLSPSGPDYFSRQFCGGTLVAPRIVITAAHCVDDRSDVDVLYGTDMLDGSGTLVASSSITVHPGWDQDTLRNDIAVVGLSRSIPTAGMHLAGHGNERSWDAGDSAAVVGFGCDQVTSGGDCASFPYDLWKASVPLRSAGACRGAFGNFFDRQAMLCAGTNSLIGNAPDSCRGDSGGPLTTTGPGGAPILVGVVSWGSLRCGTSPGVYTRVATYEPWLAQFGIGDAGGGYWLAASDGGIFAFGDAEFFGSTGGMTLDRPIVTMAPTPTRHGYWLAASDGGIFAFGDADFRGSTGGMRLNLPIVDMAPVPAGDGYWLAASDGGIFAFGSADYLGSAAGMALRRPIVTLAPTPGGGGYWLAARDGGIFSFGDASFFGSTGGMNLNMPIVDMAPTPDGRGYWLCAADGGIFAFGSAQFYGSTGAMVLNRPVVDFTPTPTGRGYWLIASDGGVFAFGDAAFYGSTGAIALNQPIVAAAAA